MAPDPGDFQRARRPEQKQQREAAILAAAEKLGLRDGVRNISLGDIAAEVSMHKTALLRYFGTREQIYLRLAADGWMEWSNAFSATLATVSPGDVAAVASAFARTLDERPLLCDLLTHAPLNLERNVSLSAILEFKLAALLSTGKASDAVRAVLPELTEADGVDLVGAVNAIAAGLWQVAHPSPTLVQLYMDNPTVSHGYIEFVPTVTRLTETLILGFRSRRHHP